MSQNQIPDKVWADIAAACDRIGQSGDGAVELAQALDRLSNAVDPEDVAQVRYKLDQHKLALQEWLDKTEWVQKTAAGHELGMHRADVLKQRIEGLSRDLEAIAQSAAVPQQGITGPARKAILSGLNGLRYMFQIAPITEDQRNEWRAWAHSVRALLDESSEPAVPEQAATRSQLAIGRDAIEYEKGQSHKAGYKQGYQQGRADAAKAALTVPQGDTVEIIGMKGGKEHHLGTTRMPPRMKAREIAREQFGHFVDDDGSDAELCFCALEQIIDYMQSTPAAPSQEPAINLSCKSTQARLAAQWGYVPAPSQPVTPDPEKWCQYVAGMIFGWLSLEKHFPDEEKCVAAIAGIIQRRLWAYKPSQEPMTLTDSAIDAATRHLYFNGKPTSKEYRVLIANTIIAALREKEAQP